jgi:hypothetical protein
VSTYTLLFIALKYEGYKVFRTCVCLIECDKQIKWNLYKLEEYRQRYASQLCTYTGLVEDTWLLQDGTVLMTKLELDFTQGNGVLSITISEGIRDEYTRRPEWIDPKM